jgi:Na+-transporting methylmalonyl-CoA/oxaloacetate decarboxylase beta subunit
MKKIIGSILIILGIGITIISLIVKIKGQIVIGGADGPTSIFFAFNVGDGFFAGIIVGLVLFAIVVFMIVRKK